jgi:hypothetical protein
MNRRKLLRIGLLGVGASAGVGVGPLSVQAQRPTVAVSSDACDTLTVAYRSGGPPEVSVTITGPEDVTIPLERGESRTLSTVAGTYEVEARPARGRTDTSRAISVEGSPVVVEPCQLVATVDCDSQTLLFSNPTGEPIHLGFWRYRSGRGYSQGWRVVDPAEVEAGNGDRPAAGGSPEGVPRT